jgi:hypothetical protein
MKSYLLNTYFIQLYISSVKVKLHEMMQTDKFFTQEDEERLNPCHQISIGNALKFIKNPVKCCQHIYFLIQELRKFIVSQTEEFGRTELYHGETWGLMESRWIKLEKDFLNKNGLFDISKVPDIYDCIKYDLQHNKKIIQCDLAEELYTYAKNMADVVIPQVSHAAHATCPNLSKIMLVLGVRHDTGRKTNHCTGNLCSFDEKNTLGFATKH